MLLRNAILTATVAVAAAGQQVMWSPPILGYFYDDQSNVLRTIAGVPGAASSDGTVPSSAKLRNAFIAPGRKFAIARTIDEGSIVLDWSRGDVTAQTLPSLVSDVSGVVFSSRGSEAAVASKDSGKVQIWRGLPDSPVLEREIALTAQILAISDYGQLAWVDSDGVNTLDGDTPKLVAPGNYSALAFKPATGELAAARSDDTVISLSIGSGETLPATLATSEDGIAEPAGLQFSADASRLVIANSRGKSATILNVLTHVATTLNCDCKANLVSTTVANAVFRITAAADGPLVYVDADSPEPRIFLVPIPGVSR